MKQDQLLQGTRVVLLARLPGATLAMFESCRVVHRLCSRIIHGPVRERVDMYISGCACACLCLRSHACMRACVDDVCFVGKGAKACAFKAGDLGQSAAETAELSSKLRGM